MVIKGWETQMGRCTIIGMIAIYVYYKLSQFFSISKILSEVVLASCLTTMKPLLRFSRNYIYFTFLNGTFTSAIFAHIKIADLRGNSPNFDDYYCYMQLTYIVKIEES